MTNPDAEPGHASFMCLMMVMPVTYSPDMHMLINTTFPARFPLGLLEICWPLPSCCQEIDFHLITSSPAISPSFEDSQAIPN